MNRRDLFAHEEEEDSDEPSKDRRCTPDLLFAFIQKTRQEVGRMPTLRECKAEFGGILGPMVDFWELQRQGRV